MEGGSDPPARPLIDSSGFPALSAGYGEPGMETTTLGRSGLQVTPICFGTWQLGGDWGSFGEDEAIAAIRRAREIGINFFDTAQGYGFGASERLLARALGDEIRSDDVVVATKGGLRPEGDGIVRDSSPEGVRQGVEASLEALGVEQIDLYQIHWPDPDVSFALTVEMLEELVEDGKIAHIGVSNFDAGHLAAFERARPVETLQPPYHLFRREVEKATLPYCEEHDIGVMVYGPLAHGLLTGAMSRETSFGDDDWRSASPMFEGEEFRTNLELVAELQRLPPTATGPLVNWPSPGPCSIPPSTWPSSAPAVPTTSPRALGPPTSASPTRTGARSTRSWRAPCRSRDPVPRPRRTIAPVRCTARGPGPGAGDRQGSGKLSAPPGADRVSDGGARRPGSRCIQPVAEPAMAGRRRAAGPPSPDAAGRGGPRAG